MKMVNVDIDPYGEHDKPDAQPDKHLDEGQTIPLTMGGAIGGGFTWEPE